MDTPHVESKSKESLSIKQIFWNVDKLAFPRIFLLHPLYYFARENSISYQRLPQPIEILLLIFKEIQWSSSLQLSLFLFSPLQSWPQLGDAAPTTGALTVSALTPTHAGPDGVGKRIPAVLEITPVPPIPTMSKPASFSLVQVKAVTLSACGGMVVTQFRVVGGVLLLIRRRSWRRSERYNVLIQSDNSEGLPWWEWLCLL